MAKSSKTDPASFEHRSSPDTTDLRSIGIRIRPMTESDAGAVLEVERLAYPYPWSESIFRDCLRVGYCCWVLEQRDLVDGYGIMAVGAGESHILNLCIRPAAQRRGLGRRLLLHLLEVAYSHRADTTLLEVRPSNPGAIQLYERVGFNEVGVRRGYYPDADGREDALLYAIELATLGLSKRGA